MFKHWTMKALFCASLIFGAGIPALAKPQPMTAERIAEIDTFVEERMEALAIPGVAIALIEDGALVHARGFGVTGEGGDPVSEKTMFQTGSISKTFAATAILQLASEQRIGLDDPVVKHLPWFRTISKARSDTITVRHLLSHRSGLSMFKGNRNQDGGSDGADAMELAVRELAGQKLQSEPGALYEYSNANYQILGTLLEAIEGQSYEEILKKRIFETAGMSRSLVTMATASQQDAAQGHRYWLTRPLVYTSEAGRAVLAQGGVSSSSSDLATYLISFINNDNQLVAEGLQAEMLTSEETGPGPHYALGWFTRAFEDHRLIFHTGSNPGYEAVAGFSPEKKFGFVVLANANSSFGNRDVATLTLGVGNMVMGLPVSPASPDMVSRIGYFIICLIPLFMISVIVGFFLIRKSLVSLKGQPLSGAVLLRLVLPSLALLALAWLLLITIPQVNGAPVPAIALFNPDIGLALRTGGYLALFWASVRPILRWRAGRA
ncbi:serine hydrolase domain-containing protein [Parasphingorhabdus sp.]|uniref:serine hydrolase domain-containing protein n=1 Tax=Parasphingorhabdus sp. TaxID=2709688 RepID=UPI003267ADD8